MLEILATNSSDGKKQQLALDGFIYLKERQSNDKITWVCEKTRICCCRARLFTNVAVETDPKILEQKGNHNHDGDQVNVEATKVKSEIKEKTANSRQSLDTIVENAYSMVKDSAVLAILPTREAMKETVRRIRFKLLLNNKKDQEEFDYSVTASGEPFVLFDSGDLDQWMIIFGTKQSVKLLADSQHWYLYGSYKKIPTSFKQLYTIHCIQDSSPSSLLYVLLPNESKELYCKIFEAIKDNCHPESSLPAPKSIIVDHNQNMIEAIKSTFPDSEIRGCQYHFRQSVMSAVDENGLQSRFGNDLEFNLKIKSLLALSYVPESRVTQYFRKLSDSDIFSHEESKIVEYFENTWIGQYGNDGNVAKPQNFSPQIWNCFESFSARHKIDENIELWHRSFDHKIGDNFYKFIRAIHGEEATVSSRLFGPLPPKKRKYNYLSNRLCKRIEAFDTEQDPIMFLRSVASII